MKKALVLLLLAIYSTLYSSALPPKREFRGAWIATIGNIDWPPSGGNSDSQKQALINILDNLRDAGINAVVFQIRPECDAMYASTIEPWSYYLTGAQGRAPSPFYDPLQFAVEEAHKRGMELHAWFNPYRVQKTSGAYPTAANHISKTHPEWILSKNKYRYLDPGLPQVRDYVIRVFMDVVRRYDIDAVHFDDYFYPYEGISNEDDASFALYNRGFSNRNDWRRDNINLFVRTLHDSLESVKPYVKLGISPFGIRKNSDAGTGGMESYYAIYCDPLAWIKDKSIDYLTPQVYWAFDRAVAPYGKLVPWWASVMDGLHLYVGQGIYNMETASAFPSGQWPASEVGRQVRFNRANDHVEGNVFYTTNYITRNVKGIRDSLVNDIYRHPAIFPVMAWKETNPPHAPVNLRFAQKIKGGPALLQWDAPEAEGNGELAARYVVYRSDFLSIGPADLENVRYLQQITGLTESAPRAHPVNGTYAYAVTALDRNANESLMSNVITISPPPQPQLAFPADHQPGIGSQVALKWRDSGSASSYEVQVASDSTFTGTLLVNKSGIQDTTCQVTGLIGGIPYYWRVRGANPSGAGLYSDVGRFTSSLPAAPVLLYPANMTQNVPVIISCHWRHVPDISFYQLQVSRSLNFEYSSLVYDSANLTDSTAALPILDMSRIYFWRVRVENSLGMGPWSAVYRFKTTSSTDVAVNQEMPYEFDLKQNHPNPFNPVTQIEFSLPNDGIARLCVYDMLGKEVVRLVDGPLRAGAHSVSLDARHLASGVYLYRLSFAHQVLSRRMMLVK